MIYYILYSTGCSGLLLLVYILMLEKEKMHRFKRAYLLLSIIFSYIVPLIVVQKTVETIVVSKQDLPGGVSSNAMQDTWEPARVIVFISMAVTIVLLARLIRSIHQFRSSIRCSKKLKYQNAVLVLQEEEPVPHSFLHFIFVGKTTFENGEIASEILHHELAHVQQKHSYDVLFAELAHCVAWFNPLLYFYKKAIRLNHEFLADEAVTNSFDDVKAYQYLLLEKFSGRVPAGVSSWFDFGAAKKRLLMMGKSTSRPASLYRKMLLLPVLLLTFYLFGQRVKTQVPIISSISNVSRPERVVATNIAKQKTLPSIKQKTGRSAVISKPLTTLKTKLPPLGSLTGKLEGRLSPLEHLPAEDFPAQQ